MSSVSSSIFRYGILALIFLTSPLQAEDLAPPTSDTWKEAFAEIQDRLRKEKGKEELSEAELSPLKSPELTYVGRAVEAKMMSIVRSGKSKPLYNQKTPSAAVRFIQEHQGAFAQALAENTVPPEIIAATLWIETHYKAYRPRFPALSTIVSLAALSVPTLGDNAALRIEALAKEESRRRGKDNGWKEVKWIERARSIGDFYYEELKALLHLAKRLNWKASEVGSSWAGAVGYSQALPSTALRNMRLDGEKPLRTLWSWDDTIQLTARHLAENGWKLNATEVQQRDAIHGYNNAEWYVNAVLKLAALIREEMASKK